MTAVTATAVVAMASAGGVAAGGCVHTGAGVARRDAYHERRAEERAQLHEVKVEELLANEARGNVATRVAADSYMQKGGRTSVARYVTGVTDQETYALGARILWYEFECSSKHVQIRMILLSPSQGRPFLGPPRA